MDLCLLLVGIGDNALLSVETRRQRRDKEGANVEYENKESKASSQSLCV